MTSKEGKNLKIVQQIKQALMEMQSIDSANHMTSSANINGSDVIEGTYFNTELQDFHNNQ